MISRTVNTLVRNISTQPLSVSKFAQASRVQLAALWRELTGQNVPWYWPRQLLAIAVFLEVGEFCFTAHPDELFDRRLHAAVDELQKTRAELEAAKAQLEDLRGAANERTGA